MLKTSGGAVLGQFFEHPFLSTLSLAAVVKKKLMLGSILFLMGGGTKTIFEATYVKSDFDVILLRPYDTLNETCTVIAN